MSNTAGYVLLGAALVPTIAGWALSDKALDEVGEAAKKANEVATETAATLATTQRTLAQATGPSADALASSTSDIAQKTSELATGIDAITDALNEMRGRFAPARVCFALAFLLVLGALVALDVLTIGG